MDAHLKTLLNELEAYGHAHDARERERGERMLNVTRDTGEFLRVLVLATRARNILEIGTSNGYSTLWLASAAAAVDGTVSTVELSESKYAIPQENFRRANLAQRIVQVRADAGVFLQNAGDAAFDLVFLDSRRPEYVNWKADLKRVLRCGGLLVVDNAVSHMDEMAPFAAALEADPDFVLSLVQVGKGELLAYRQ